MPTRASTPAGIPLAKPIGEVPAGALATLRRAAAGCTACPLYRHATQTVFGAGPAKARIMLIGEQPGAQEDRQGRPFVGPAGRLLRNALADAGIPAGACYLTNAVKHFKFRQRGKIRLHQRADADEQAACRPWLAAELSRVRPRWIVALGAMAAQTLFGNGFRIRRDHGRWQAIAPDVGAMATWHPSALLRMPGPGRAEAMAEFARDLRSLAEHANERHARRLRTGG